MVFFKNSTNRLWLLAFFIFCQTNTVIAQYKPLRIASASDLRIRHKSNNVTSTSSVKKISDRGYKKVAYIITGQDHISVQNVGLLIFNNTYLKIPLSKVGGIEVLDSLFQVGFTKSAIELVQLPEDQRFEISKAMYAKGRLHKNEKALKLFKELSESIDAIVVIEELPSFDFFTGSKEALSAKGIYKGISRKKAFVYAGHTVKIYDVETAKVISSWRDVQFSGDYLPFDFDKNKINYSSDELNIIEKILRERYQNNVKQSFRFLKIY